MNQKSKKKKPFVRFKKRSSKVLWKNHPVRLDDFAAIREYVDDCLNRNYASNFHDETYTDNTNLLLSLLKELYEKLPECTEEQIKKWKEKKNQEKKINKKVMDQTFEKINNSINKLGDFFPEGFLKQLEEPEIDVEDILFKRRVLSRLEGEIKHKTYNGRIYRRMLDWIILPPGENWSKKIREYYENLFSKRPEIRFDYTRLDKIEALNPDYLVLGQNGFDGYRIYYFKVLETAVLESPEVGNAIYIIKENWEFLSRLSKKELREQYFQKIVRVTHAGDWFGKLKKRLDSIKSGKKMALLRPSAKIIC